jgi:hypothetical protein
VVGGADTSRDVDAWSLLSLLLSLIALIMGIGLVLRCVFRRQTDIDMLGLDTEVEARALRRRRVRRVMRPMSIILAFIPGIVWLWLDDLRLPMTWYNRWTPCVIIAFIVFALMFIGFIIAKRRRNGDEDADYLDEDRWYVNRNNTYFKATGIMTLLFAAIGIIVCIMLTRISIPDGQIGGILLLVFTGIPSMFMGAFDNDLVLARDRLADK